MTARVPGQLIASTHIAGAIAMFVIAFSAWADDTTAQSAVSSAQSGEAPPGWSLQLPKEEKVVFRGAVSFDTAGTGNASVLYPAPNAAGFLAGVLAHGLIVNSAKSSQKEKLQEAADKVLAPYRTVLDGFTTRDLMERALKKTTTGGHNRLIEPSAQPDTGWLIESAPVFAMTQDQRAIVMDNAIILVSSGNVRDAENELHVRVVSHPLTGDDPAAIWSANMGEKLKATSAELLAESVDIAFRAAAASSGATGDAYKTIRYRQGGVETMERAQLVSARCHRAVIRNLRGWLMSVPIAASDHCEGMANSLQ